MTAAEGVSSQLSSNLTNLANVDSLNDFPTTAALAAAPTDPASYRTVTVDKVYSGDAGVIALNSYLAGDGSPSDRLVINGGSASGSSALMVKNAMGPGDLTTGNGILVIDAVNNGTTTADAFALGAAVIAGPYEYLLYRGSVDASAPDSWHCVRTSTAQPPARRRRPVPRPHPHPRRRPAPGPSRSGGGSTGDT